MSFALLMCCGLVDAPETIAFAQGFGQAQPPRDTPSQAQVTADGTPAVAIVSGRVTHGRTGRPLPRARVLATARDTGRRRHTVLTDEHGEYALSGLTPGRYTITVSRPGFVTMSYGQRRPRQPSSPVEVKAGEHLHDLDMTLPVGGVITGIVVDENGVPLPLATVRVMRYMYQQGRQQLVPADSDRTDDRGRYRVFALEPGDYFVSASAPRQLLASGGGERLGPGRQGPRGLAGPFGGASPGSPGEDPGDTGPLGYAPTFYPGTTSIADASRVTVGLSAEAGGVDFGVRLVATADVSGRVFESDGSVARGVQVLLIPDDGPPVRDAILGARLQPDGTFTIRNVPAGQYTLRAATRGRQRGSFGGGPVFASQPVAVDGYDIRDVTLVLTPGTTLTGTVEFQTTQARPDDLPRVRITTDALRDVPFLTNPTAPLNGDGTFRLENVPGGARVLRARGIPDGWMLKAVYLDGRDVIDTPLDFSGTAQVDGIRLVVTDQVSRLGGFIQDRMGRPSPEFTVIAFPADESEWHPQSRRTRAARPDQNGRYEIEGLPPGGYLLAAVDVVQDGEWLDPWFLRQLRRAAVRVSLSEGESRDVTLTLDTSAP